MKSWDDAFRYFMQDVFEMRSIVAGFVVVVSQETKKGVCFVGFVYVDKESESKREEREDNQSSRPRILGSRLLPLLPPVERFLKPSFIPIFFQGFSVRSLGLWMGRCGSLAGGVVGGVMGSSAVGLDCGEAESSVRDR